jgi:hypothetical protein
VFSLIVLLICLRIKQQQWNIPVLHDPRRASEPPPPPSMNDTPSPHAASSTANASTATATVAHNAATRNNNTATTADSEQQQQKQQQSQQQQRQQQSAGESDATLLPPPAMTPVKRTRNQATSTSTASTSTTATTATTANLPFFSPPGPMMPSPASMYFAQSHNVSDVIGLATPTPATLEEVLSGLASPSPRRRSLRARGPSSAVIAGTTLNAPLASIVTGSPARARAVFNELMSPPPVGIAPHATTNLPPSSTSINKENSLRSSTLSSSVSVKDSIQPTLMLLRAHTDHEYFFLPLLFLFAFV